MNRIHGHGTGFSLLELAIAVLAAAILVLGVVTLAQAVTGAARLQQNVSALRENARFALQSIGAEVRQAGYPATPWAEPPADPFLGSGDNAAPRGDRLVVNRWSDHNCYDNANPALDALGRPRIYLRTSTFEVTAARQLALTCAYGPDTATQVRQVNRLGLVEHVYELQARFALDTDADGNADAWSDYAPWAAGTVVTGVQATLLLASPDAYAGPADDDTGPARPSDRLSRVVAATWQVKARGSG